jgi:hypothetical protein
MGRVAGSLQKATSEVARAQTRLDCQLSDGNFVREILLELMDCAPNAQGYGRGGLLRTGLIAQPSEQAHGQDIRHRLKIQRAVRAVVFGLFK